jgi:adenylate kinase
MPTFPFVPTKELIGSRMRTSRAYPREIVFLGGAPGSGKGTNSSFISNMRNFTAPTIVVSDLLNTPTCKILKDNGVMVDDDFVFSVLLKELEKPIYSNGVVVDGFPRTAKQAEYLTNFYHEQSHSSMSPPRMLFVMLHVDEAASIQRQQLRGRKIVELNSVREQMQLPPLEIRATDVSIDASKARYTVFEEQLSAVLTLGVSFPLVMVDASSSLEAVRSNIAEQMTSLPGPLYMLD